VPKVEVEIERIRAELLQARSQGAELHESAAVSAAKLEAEVVQRRIIESNFKEALSKAHADAKKSGEDAAELRGQLAQAKSKSVAANKVVVSKPIKSK
jgi:hypothetical protein